MIIKQMYLLIRECLTSESDPSHSLAKMLISHNTVVSKLKEHKLRL